MPWIGGERLLIEVHRLDHPSCLELLKGFGGQDCGRSSARCLATRGGRFEPSHLTTLLSIHGQIISIG